MKKRHHPIILLLSTTMCTMVSRYIGDVVANIYCCVVVYIYWCILYIIAVYIGMTVCLSLSVDLTVFKSTHIDFLAMVVVQYR